MPSDIFVIICWYGMGPLRHESGFTILAPVCWMAVFSKKLVRGMGFVFLSFLPKSKMIWTDAASYRNGQNFVERRRSGGFVMMNIRNVKMEDLEQLIDIEHCCFTKEEAASREAFVQRIRLIPDSFFVAEKEGRIVGLVNGPVIAKPCITDDLFKKIQANPPVGGHQSILGLAVHPDYQGQGIGKALLFRLESEARNRRRKTVTLTCKEELISFYEALGYTNQGLSGSQHAGVHWFNMVKELG